MIVADTADVAMWPPQGRFAYVRSPFYLHTDFPWQSGLAMLERSDGWIADYDLQAIYPRPLRIPVNLKLDPGIDTFFDADWSSLITTYRHYYRPSLDEIGLKLAPEHNCPLNESSLDKFAFTPLFVQDVELPTPIGWDLRSSAYRDYYKVGVESHDLLDQEVNGLLFEFDIFPQMQIEQDNGSFTATDTPNDKMMLHCGIDVGSHKDAISYRITTDCNFDVALSMRDSHDGVWKEIERRQSQTGSSAPGFGGKISEGGSSYPIEWRLIGGQLQVRVGAAAFSAKISEDRIDGNDQPIRTISRFFIVGEKIASVQCHAYILRFPSSISYRSSEIPIGFFSNMFSGITVDAAAVDDDGWTATLNEAASEITGPIVIYELDITGPSDGTFKGTAYANNPYALRAVNLSWAKDVYMPFTYSVYPQPEEVTVQHSFDIDSLQIASGASLRMNSNRWEIMPNWNWNWWGNWAMQSGQGAAEIALRRTASGGPSDTYGAPYKVFTGYANTRTENYGSGGAASTIIYCEDRRRQLMSERFALPWMDGWNVYFAMAYLAGLGGVDIWDLEFAPLVPLSPYDDMGDGEGARAYFLPVGASGSVLTRFSGMKLWEIMSKIAYAIGFMLFFDVNGRLQFRKFRLAPGVKRSFFESDRESGGLEGAWSATISKSMDAVRSDAIVVGIDAFAPRYDPIVYKYTDEAVVYNPFAFNHLGYRNAAVWMDSQFASAEFADVAASRMITFLRNPALEAAWTTWLQPDIFPLDVVMFQSYRLGVAWTRLMVTSIEHRKSIDGPGQSTIRARYVPS